MTQWLLEDAMSSQATPAYAAVADVGHDQIVVWTQDRHEAVQFPGSTEARQFAHRYVDRPVRVAMHVLA